MTTSKAFLCAVAFSSLLAACSKKDDDDKQGNAGTYPNIYATLKLSVPSFSATALNASPASNAHLVGIVPSTSLPFGSAQDWTDVSGSSSNTIGQLLTDAGSGGTIKSLWTVLSQAQGTIQTINTAWSDENGEPDNCTALTADNVVKIPFWSTATGSIVTIDDSGKYRCYVESEDKSSITTFGREKIAAAGASCTDPYEYYVSTAYARAGVANTGDSSYGATTDGGSATRFYYNGCDGTIKLQLAGFTKYSGGTEFSIRTEIDGNVGLSEFTMRAAWIDLLGAGGGSLNSIVGNGTTFKNGDSNGAFLIGDLVGNCPDGVSCAAPSGRGNYCIENAGTTTSSMTVAAEATCKDNSALSSGYTGLTPIADVSVGNTAGIPRELFVVSKAAMNLP